ncbi:MAG: hypothetical protein ORN98_01410 [Alphaproteobacteria bacterium]|nr:hypothetical protein [Alphaproteobacteria bacterium]
MSIGFSVNASGIGLNREEFAKRVMQWEKQKVKGNLTCNVCGEHSWALASQLGIIPTAEPDNEINDPLGYGRYVVLVCKNCGNSHSILASFITGEEITVKDYPATQS